jgi:hypothetical protein
MLTGYLSTLPSDVVFDTGVVYVGSTPIGVTKGPPNIDPAREFDNMDFDGKHAPIKGLDRVFHGPASVKFTLIEAGDATSGNQLPKLEPGGAVASAGTPNVTTITPKAGGAFAAAGDYLTDLRVIYERGVGTGTKRYFAVYLPCSLVKSWKAVGENKKVAKFDVEVEGRKDMASGTTADATYKLELREALP